MKVYLSYSSRDRATVLPIADALNEAGHDVLSDRELSPGDAWAATLSRMIDDADVVLVFWTEASIQSEWVNAEANRAIQLNKYLGFTIGKVELPLRFLRIQHRDLGEGGRHPDTAAILETLSIFDMRSAAPRSANRTVRQASKRQSQVSPPPIPPQSPPPLSREEPEIPAFLRRAPEPTPTPAAEQPGVAPAVATAAPDLDPFSFTPDAAATTAERGYDVFISYSRKDAEACKLAFDLIAERGLVPWYDKDIGSGAFKTKIVARISKASVFVLLLSKNSVGSPNVSKELSVASSSDRLIIPISIDGITPEDLNDTFRYELIELNIFNADPKLPDSWSDVINTIADSVNEVRAEAGAAVPIAPALFQPVAAAPEPPKAKVRRPVLFATMTVISGLLQQGAIGYALWNSGLVDIPMAAALAVASGVVLWPLVYGAALLARLAFRPTPG